MGYKVFISYNVPAQDYSLVTHIANLLWQHGIDAFIPDLYPRYSETVSRLTAGQIDSSDMVLALVTSQTARATARATPMFHEVQFAQQRGKHVLALVEQGINTEALLGRAQRVEFNRWDFPELVENVGQYLTSLRTVREDEEQGRAARTVGGLLLAGLFLWLLSQGGKGKES